MKKKNVKDLLEKREREGGRGRGRGRGKREGRREREISIEELRYVCWML